MKGYIYRLSDIADCECCWWCSDEECPGFCIIKSKFDDSEENEEFHPVVDCSGEDWLGEINLRKNDLVPAADEWHYCGELHGHCEDGNHCDACPYGLH